jgi:pimeloyl-ACP methyl ester carboxylesterase
MKPRWVVRAAPFVALALLVFALGPRPVVGAPVAKVTVPQGPREARDWAVVHEALAAQGTGAPVRPGCESKVLLEGARGERTELALVYLHGFSACPMETSPLVEQLGRELHANVYLPRLRGHGQDGAALGEATAQAWLEDTEQALAVGASLGRRVVVIGTSTGGTLALWFAAHRPDSMHALVLLSPNLGPKDHAAELLLLPWAGQVLPRLLGERSWVPKSEQQGRYWTTRYPSKALLPMMALVEATRRAPLHKIRVPVLALYNPADDVVDAQQIEGSLKAIPSGMVTMRPLAPLGDEDAHVLAGGILSPRGTARIAQEIRTFLGNAAR